MPTDTIWKKCPWCGEVTQHKKHPIIKVYVCIVNHEKTQIALNRIKKGEDLKKRPKCKDEE